ncbi:MAG: hypothetical protein ABIR91_01630 [Candidatus Saccharimonadales bacterium]
MLDGIVPLITVTATLFAVSRVQQVSKLGLPAAAGCVVAALFVASRLFEFSIYALGSLSTGAEYALGWTGLFSWQTLGVLALQYVVALIVLALLLRYDETIAAWIAVLVIGSYGLTALLV